MKTATTVSGVLAGLFLSASAHAGNLRVPQDFATIQAAVDAAQSGDTVVVSKGTYNENVVIDEKTDVRLRGKGKPVVSASAVGPALDIVDSSDIEVRGLVFTNGSGPLGSGVRVTDCSSVKVSTCTMEDNQDDGVSVESCDDVTIEKCQVNNNDDDGICFFEVTNSLISRNKINGTAEKGIETGTNIGASLNIEISKNRVDNAGEDGIRISGSNVVAEKNRVQGSGESGIAINDNMAFPITGAQILRNRVKESGVEGIALNGSGAIAEKNILQDSTEAGMGVAGTGGHTVCKNRVVRSKEGINIKAGSDGNTLDRNKVSMAQDDGFDVESQENTLEKNSARQSGNNGFEVNDTNNLLTRNSASKSGGFDLFDDAGGNTYDKNNFKTQDFVTKR